MRAWFEVGLLVLAALWVGCSPTDGSEPEPSWEEAFSADEFGWVLSIAGRSPDDVYAVGGAPRAGAVHRFDGDEWSSVAVPSDVRLVTWVHCFEDGRPVMATFGGEVLWRRDGEWEVDDVPTDQDLWGVWGASPDDVWAVGGSERPTIVRYDGSSWSTVAVPELRNDNVAKLFKVWGSGPDDVFIVGENGTILHWDGEALRDQSLETRKDIISLWGTGPDRIAAVGGRGGGILARWDGSDWSIGSLTPLAGVQGVWVPNAKTAWVAGARGKVGRVDLTSDELDKSVMQLVTERDFHAIYGIPGRGLYAVGGNLDEPDRPRGTAWFRNSIE